MIEKPVGMAQLKSAASLKYPIADPQYQYLVLNQKPCIPDRPGTNPPVSHLDLSQLKNSFAFKWPHRRLVISIANANAQKRLSTPPLGSDVRGLKRTFFLIWASVSRRKGFLFCREKILLLAQLFH
ncbi:hypothetical protein AVEN_153401-1 [Araneus ventricosus]|uniref:Uncharacterized protein n=1 Tax=Araneus ventricosus TaxID=182803 RepID=A0A4Y2EA41_ARAVE|nr:hypothetical protein AVEN_153401-1 [Araneus ventricosus]